jgi:hypothetical protein
MFRSMMRKLTNNFATTSQRPARSLTRRPTLAVEGLEDRLVMTATAFNPPTLDVFASPDRAILFTRDSGNSSLLDVFDGGTLLGKFKASLIQKLNVTVAGHDAINFDDSNGFAVNPGTVVTINGSGVGNSLSLGGSKAVGSEAYDGGFAGGLGQLSVDASLFRFGSTIRSVTDDLTSTGTLFVNALGHHVTLTGNNFITDTLTGLADGGAGDTLTFLGKPEVSLAPNLDGTTVDLNAPAPARGLKTFRVDVASNNDVVNVNTTSFAVKTLIDVNSQHDQVNLRANRGAVTINGGATTTVALGTNFADAAKSVTSGIVGNVTVNGAGSFFIVDGGNVTTKEVIRVTESTISGVGMFGANATTVHYAHAAPIIVTGQLAEQYTVLASHPGARFNDDIFILDEFSNAGLKVFAGMDAGSGLHLHLFNKNAAKGSLFVAHKGGKVNPNTLPTPNGIATVTFPVGLTSTISYTGFDVAKHN